MTTADGTIPSLVYRRYRGDMIEVFKYLRGMYSDPPNICQLPSAPVTALRGHDFKLMKRHCRSHARLTFFSFRVATLWNNLPSEVVSAPSLNILIHSFIHSFILFYKEA